MAKMKERKCGAKQRIPNSVFVRILKLRLQGINIKKIASETNVSRAEADRVISMFTLPDSPYGIRMLDVVKINRFIEDNDSVITDVSKLW